MAFWTIFRKIGSPPNGGAAFGQLQFFEKLTNAAIAVAAAYRPDVFQKLLAGQDQLTVFEAGL
jgi:hypothetical protein